MNVETKRADAPNTPKGEWNDHSSMPVANLLIVNPASMWGYQQETFHVFDPVLFAPRFMQYTFHLHGLDSAHLLQNFLREIFNLKSKSCPWQRVVLSPVGKAAFAACNNRKHDPSLLKTGTFSHHFRVAGLTTSSDLSFE